MLVALASVGASAQYMQPMGGVVLVTLERMANLVIDLDSLAAVGR